jgi:hypothetical protein
VKSFIVLLFALVSSCTTLRPTSTDDMAAASVRLITASGRGGGTGSILTSGKSKSQILTNRHVCTYVGVGGTAETTTGSYKVTATKASEVHDLCIMEVAVDLGVNTEVASSAPKQGEPVSVSGHPKLLPHIRMDGHLSKEMTIEVLVGFEPCTDKDMEGEMALYCIFMGGKPIVEAFESQLTSALISPGNSGSAVYNSSGKIVGLIFAGSGDLSPGFMVPWAYVKDFVDYESKSLKPQLKAAVPKAKSTSTRFFFNPIYIENEEASVNEQIKNRIFYNLINNKEATQCLRNTLR